MISNADYIDRIISDSTTKSQIVESIRYSRKLEFLTAGNDRVIAKLDSDNIVKIENNPSQNKKEIESYSENEDIRKHLLPISKHSDSSRCIICPIASFDISTETAYNFVEEIVSDFGILPKDLREDEIGIVNDKVVFTDYGYGFEKADTIPEGFGNSR